MKCFIASAFGHTDVDHIYKKIVKPLLQKDGVKARRVNDIEHNDDIDDVIMREMKESDFCIADLTYARPSAYFEAGYMQGQSKPVIYTVRSDHLKSTVDSLRVHFDVQMRNIVAWSTSGENKQFEERLQKRIRFVTRPLHQNKALKRIDELEQKIKRIRRAKFRAMPLRSQLAAIVERSKSELAAQMFGPYQREHDSNWVFGSRSVGTVLQSVLVATYPRITPREFHRAQVAVGLKEWSEPPIKRSQHYCVLALLHRQSRDVIRKWLPDFSSNPVSEYIFYHDRFSKFTRQPKGAMDFVILLDAIASEEEFSERLKEALLQIKPAMKLPSS